jgi:hypothetical protein
MRPERERERVGNREDYTVKEAHAPSTPPNGSTRYIIVPKAGKMLLNSSIVKASNACMVQQHMNKISM